MFFEGHNIVICRDLKVRTETKNEKYKFWMD